MGGWVVGMAEWWVVGEAYMVSGGWVDLYACALVALEGPA